MIYLDNSATTPIADSVLDLMNQLNKQVYGNPSSVHGKGQEAKKYMEEARENISMYLKIQPRELIFTASGSESNNMALRGIMKSKAYEGKHIISTKIEHSSVLKTLEDLERDGFDISYINVNEKGHVNLEELEKSIRPDTRLVSIIHANNEIGTIQNLEEISKLIKKHKIILHVDAVQSFGKMPIYPKDLSIDLMSISAHKIYGPKGIAGLFVATGTKLEKIITGGYQERNRRAGTENVVNICAFSKSVELSYANLYSEKEKEESLRNYMEEEILKKILKVKINGDRNNRLFNISSLTIDGVEAESLIFALDLKGICISAGSACSSGTLSPSPVLEAIGLDKKSAKSTIRISLGRYNTKEEIDKFIDILELSVLQERNLY